MNSVADLILEPGRSPRLDIWTVISILEPGRSPRLDIWIVVSILEPGRSPRSHKVNLCLGVRKARGIDTQ